MIINRIIGVVISHVTCNTHLSLYTQWLSLRAALSLARSVSMYCPQRPFPLPLTSWRPQRLLAIYRPSVHALLSILALFLVTAFIFMTPPSTQQTRKSDYLTVIFTANSFAVSFVKCPSIFGTAPASIVDCTFISLSSVIAVPS
jgi:hypothetical protein